MRKALLIGLLVCALALGTIGAAFATDMNITGVGALSSGTAGVTDVNVVRIDWSLGGNAHNPIIDQLAIVFDQDLKDIDPGGGTTDNVQGEILIDFQDSNHNSVGMFYSGTPELCDSPYLLSSPTSGNPIYLDVRSANADPHDVEYIKVTYCN